MVDTQHLEDLIARSGKKKSYIAEKCGCSIQTLRLKINNTYPFTTDQVEVLCSELNITRLTDKERIFFAQNVDKQSTK